MMVFNFICIDKRRNRDGLYSQQNLTQMSGNYYN